MTIRYHDEYRHWHHWDEFLAYCRQEPDTSRFLAKRKASASKRFAFNGVNSYEEALELAERGWAEGRDLALEMSQPIINKLVQFIERPDLVYDVEGNGFDIGRFCAKDPECAIRFENEIVEVPAVPRLIRIVNNNLASGGVSKEVLTARGAAIAALVELLEFAGNRVQIVNIVHGAGLNGSVDECGFMHTVTIKEFDQPLDMGRVIFALAHPAMMRCLGFRVAELASAQAQEDIGYGYGNVILNENTDFLKDYNLTPDIFFTGAHLHDRQWENEGTAQKWVLDNLEKQGVKINREALNGKD